MPPASWQAAVGKVQRRISQLFAAFLCLKKWTRNRGMVANIAGVVGVLVAVALVPFDGVD